MRINQLELLTARAAVTDVLGQFCQRIDAYDIDAVVRLFTEDCVTDYGPGLGGEVLGREALRTRLLRSQARFRRTHHQLGQISIDVSGDGASTIAYATCWHETWDGVRKIARIQYHDRMVEQEEGAWLIAQRRAFAAGTDGFEDTEWNWVPRLQPPAQLLPKS